MVIWQGLGALGALIAIAIFAFLTDGMTDDGMVSQAMATVICGVVLFVLGILFRKHADSFSAKLAAEDEPTKGRKAKTAIVDSIGINRAHRPSVFFIPLHWWGIVFVVIGGVNVIAPGTF